MPVRGWRSCWIVLALAQELGAPVSGRSEPAASREAQARRHVAVFHVPTRYWSDHLGFVSSPEHEAAIHALVRIGRPAVWPLVEALADPDFQARFLAARMLQKIRDSRAVEPLIRVLREDPRWDVRWQVASALAAQHDSRGRDALLEEVRTSNGGPPVYVLNTLEAFPDTVVVEALLGVLVQEDSILGPGSGTRAAQSLGRMGRPGRIALLGAAHSPDVLVRGHAAIGLIYTNSSSREVRDSLIRLLSDPDATIRGTTADWLGLCGRRGRWAVPWIRPLLNDPEPGVRWTVAEALGQMRDPGAAPGLIRHLADADEDVVSSVMLALEWLHPRSATPHLLPFLNSDEPVRRAAAARILGRIGDRKVIPAVLPLARDAEDRVRAGAFEALGRLRCRDARPLLLDALRGPAPEVRSAAAEGLGYLGDRTVVRELIPLLSDPEFRVREVAESSLDRLRKR